MSDIPACMRKAEDTWDEDGFNWIMDEMIFSFDHEYRCAYDDDYEEDYYYATGEMDYIMQDGEWGKTGPNHTYEVNEEKRKEFEERVTNGFRLFGKYFQNLWD